MINIKDYELPDGKIDWKAYHKAEVANGDSCYNCGHFILFSKGYQTLCNKCNSLHNKGEVNHHSLVRCPHCGAAKRVDNGDDYDLYSEGEHSTSCFECSKEYTVSTSVSFNFRSEPRVPDEYSR